MPNPLKISKEWLEDGEEPKKSSRVLPLAIPLVLLFCFPFLGLLFRDSEFSKGARLFWGGYSFRLSFSFVLLFGFVHWILVRNWETLALPVVDKKWLPLSRVFLSLTLWGTALVSLSYYLGHSRDLMDAQEIFFAVVPAVLIAAIYYESERNAWVASFFLTVAVFIPLFVLNDVLAPFYTLVNYASIRGNFYLVRSVCPPFAVAVTFLLFPFEQTKAMRFKSQATAAGLILASGLFLQYGLPVVTKMVDKNVDNVGVVNTTALLFQLAAFLFLFFQRGKNAKGLPWICFSVLAAVILSYRNLMMQNAFNFWSWIWISQATAAFLFYFCLSFGYLALERRQNAGHGPS